MADFPSTSRYRYSTVIQKGAEVFFGPRARYSTDLALDDAYFTAQAEDDLARVSARAFGDARYWWVVADFNGIVNPFEVLTAGQELRVPSRRRLFMEVLR